MLVCWFCFYQLVQQTLTARSRDLSSTDTEDKGISDEIYDARPQQQHQQQQHPQERKKRIQYRHDLSKHIKVKLQHMHLQ